MKNLIAVVLSIALMFGGVSYAKEYPVGKIYVDDSLMSRTLQDVVFKVCEENGESTDFAYFMIALGEIESGGDIEIVGCTGDIGLFQINPKYSADRMEKLGVSRLTNAEDNTRVAYDILKEHKEKFPDKAALLMAYNGGSAYALRKISRGEISDYVRKVLYRYDLIMLNVQKERQKRVDKLKEKEHKKYMKFVKNYQPADHLTAGAEKEMMRMVGASLEYYGK